MDCVSEELLDRMALAGCRGIYYGVETGSRWLQSVVKKRLDLDLYQPILDSSLQKNMKVTVSFITGFPEERHEDQLATANLLGECFLRSDAQRINRQWHLLTPEPGTELFHKLKNELLYDGYVTDQNFLTMEIDDAELMQSHPEIFMTHFYYPTLLPRSRNIFVTSATHSLNKIGAPVVAHTLDFYDAKLGVFLMRMWEWTQKIGYEGPCDEDLIVRFIEDEFGIGHYLTSLFSYMNALQKIGNVSLIKKSPGASLPADGCTLDVSLSDDVSFVIAKNVVLWSDYFDCANLVEALQSGNFNSEYAVRHAKADRRNFILTTTPSRRTECKSFEITSNARTLIELFHEPTSVSQCSTLLGLNPAQKDELRGFVKALLKRRILDRVTDLPQHLTVHRSLGVTC